MVRTGNVAASRGSSPALDAGRGPGALVLLAALAPALASGEVGASFGTKCRVSPFG